MECIDEKGTNGGGGRNVKWVLRLLVGGVIAAMATDFWELLQSGIGHLIGSGS